MPHEFDSKPTPQDFDFSSSRKSKILVIDDSLLMRKLLSDQLSCDRFEIHEAEDGPTGLIKANEIKPDLILLDYLMPGMDGQEVYKNLRHQDKFANTPIIIMSGAYDEIVQKFGSPFGKCDFLPKQASQDQLRDRINAVLPMTVIESGSNNETKSQSVNIAVQDIAAVMTHLGQLENRLMEGITESHAPIYNWSPQTNRFSQLPTLLITAALSAVGAIFFYSTII
jgi:DNA-binding response OmpR family regulator